MVRKVLTRETGYRSQSFTEFHILEIGQRSLLGYSRGQDLATYFFRSLGWFTRTFPHFECFTFLFRFFSRKKRGTSKLVYYMEFKKFSKRSILTTQVFYMLVWGMSLESTRHV